MKAVTFPMEIKQGSVSVKIYKTPSRGCDSFTLSYYLDGKRHRPTFSCLKLAKKEAHLVVSRLASSSADVLTLRSADRAAYLRAIELLSGLDTSIEMAAAEFASARRALGGVPIARAVEYYLKQHPSQIKPIAIGEVIAELLASRKQDKLSPGYIKHLG